MSKERKPKSNDERAQAKGGPFLGLARSFETGATPEARNVGRILSGTAANYLMATAAPTERERARGRKVLATVAKKFPRA
jgi:hypothetical protein